MMKRVATGLAAGLGVLWAGAACGKTLVYCSEGNPESLNPQTMTTTTGISAGRPFFNNLVEFRLGTTEVAPSLAESWTISDDAAWSSNRTTSSRRAAR
jgi:dipeptide transport system substrate-binding protein